MKRATIIFDGGAIGNPGRGYGSYCIAWPDGQESTAQLQFPEFGSRMTNNQAEYETLIRAMQAIVDELGSKTSDVALTVRGDSRLVLNQLKGTWKVRNQGLQPFYARSRDLARKFGQTALVWHPREESVRILGH